MAPGAARQHLLLHGNTNGKEEICLGGSQWNAEASTHNPERATGEKTDEGPRIESYQDWPERCACTPTAYPWGLFFIVLTAITDFSAPARLARYRTPTTAYRRSRLTAPSSYLR